MPEEQNREYEDRVTLFSWLETIQRSFDPKLLAARQRFNESAGWVGKPGERI